MRALLTCLFVLGSFWATAQLAAEPSRVDYGELLASSDRWVDVVLTNHGGTATQVLRSSFPPDYTFRFSTKVLQPDSSLVIRIKANPRKRGKFHDEVEVWFTTMNAPIVLRFSGDVKEIDRSGDTACPSFRDVPPACCDELVCVVETIDASNGQPLGKSRVRLIELGRLRATWETNRKGRLELDVPIAYYMLLADHEGYAPADTALYINRRTPFIQVALTPLEVPLPPEPLPVEIAELHVEEVLEEAEAEQPVVRPSAPDAVGSLPPKTVGEGQEAPALQDSHRPLHSVPELDAPDPEVLDDTFEADQYRPNNIVFLIDVSASMKKRGRLELLRASMHELTDVLRRGDKFSLVTYAISPEIRLEGANGDQKDAISTVVNTLEPDGMTYGVRGFRTAYELARKYEIPGGNNQVIVVSDGAFRVEDLLKIERLVTRAAEDGIVTSMVGIRHNPALEPKLEVLSAAGDGAFVPLLDFDQCQQALVQEIKLRSRIED